MNNTESRTDSWRSFASCLGRDVNIFFPEWGKNRAHKPVINQICGDCPVKQECLEYALSLPEQIGFFGGMSARERERILVLRKRL